MAVTSNIYIDAGTHYNKIFTVTDNDNQPINITGYAIKSQMRKSYSSTTAYALNCSIFNADIGEILVELTDLQSGAIPAGRYLYDIEITSSSGIKTRIAEGLAIVSPQITQI